MAPTLPPSILQILSKKQVAERERERVREVARLNVDVTSLIELPVGGGVAFRAVLSDGNLDLHNGTGCICEN